ALRRQRTRRRPPQARTPPPPGPPPHGGPPRPCAPRRPRLALRRRLLRQLPPRRAPVPLRHRRPRAAAPRWCARRRRPPAAPVSVPVVCAAAALRIRPRTPTPPAVRPVTTRTRWSPPATAARSSRSSSAARSSRSSTRTAATEPRRPGARRSDVPRLEHAEQVGAQGRRVHVRRGRGHVELPERVGHLLLGLADVLGERSPFLGQTAVPADVRDTADAAGRHHGSGHLV